MAPQLHHHDSPGAAVTRRARILSNHLLHRGAPSSYTHQTLLSSNACLSYSPAELTETISFDTKEMRRLLDFHHIAERDWVFGLIEEGEVFNPVKKGGKVFVMPDLNLPFQQQREITMRRTKYLFDKGVHKGCYTENGPEWHMKSFAIQEVLRIYDIALGGQMAVHFFLWGGTIKNLGTKHHEKWLRATENYEIIGCLAMSELGHGSNVHGLETVTTYDSSTGEFVVNTPCESAQKYMISLAADYATHAVVFSQLHINGKNEGIHAFIVQIRDANGKTCPNVRIADCGHKNGLNGLDNGQIWFDKARIPRENLLNRFAEVTPDGQYVSSIKDPKQRFRALLSPGKVGRLAIATTSIYKTKVSLAIAIRYALSRRAFPLTPNGPEVLLLDYPIHQRRLLPLLAKTYAMSFAGNWLKMLFIQEESQSSYKTFHVFSTAFKAVFTWHTMRTLQECREACGAQGIKAENRISLMVAQNDSNLTQAGDNNVLMMEVSKILLSEFLAAKKHKRPLKEFGLEHMNGPSPGFPSQLSSSILRSSQFQIAAMCLRERDLLYRFAAEVSKHQARGETREQAVHLAFQLSKDLSKAFSEHNILKLTIEVEEGLSTGSLKDVLALVRSLYALTCMEEDDTFLRYGYLSAENAAAVREEVSNLCRELRPHALALVSSLGIPDSFLGPIAFDYIEANSWSSSVGGGH
ncbi:Acyl-coenzyme A oxidase 3, peroxisomal [Turnera subulata]|uniref:Acyl-coenzyme A oxidase n=1 Tax=Turnera subulata TaxID=218843 RepID=A0A9Q0FRR2_9ROSI|nr:Acyl-coenzyme A oxidase 3, peroxisomal [Turnera subulata]